VLANHTASPAVALAAEEKGVKLIANQSDMRAFAPHAQLAAVMPAWGDYYTQVARDVIARRWKPTPVWGGLRSGMVGLGAIDGALPAAQRAAVDDSRRALIDGRVTIFAAPLRDNQGRNRLAGGTLGDAQIAGMDWLVQGVVGSMPTP
jgi:simple sugar transport system substrate-binding protein